MSALVVLVHAPLVGPSTWQWVAEELRAAGFRVVVPHLTVAGPASDLFEHFVEEVAAVGAAEEVVLAGHSGGGFLLPFAAARCRSSSVRCVFVDAGLPPQTGPVELAGADFRASLDVKADADGRLPPWHTWWGDDGMSHFVLDDERRARVSADIPQLPLAYFDAAPLVPDAWVEGLAGYMLLSEIYRIWADEARRLGRPVIEVFGTHLEVANRPPDVADAIISAGNLL